MKILILSSHGFGNGQMYPFKHYKNLLLEKFNITTQEMVSDCLKEKYRCFNTYNADLVIINVPAKTDRTALLDFYQNIHQCKKKQIVVHFDCGDGNHSPHFNVLPFVDLYLKQYLYNDMTEYNKTYIGGSKFIDYLVQTGYENSITNEIWTNYFQSPLLAEYYPKVMIGWNFALWRRMIYLGEKKLSIVLWVKDKPHLRLITLIKHSFDAIYYKLTGINKPIDIYCRATLYSGWTREHRRTALRKCLELKNKFNVVAEENRVGFSEYYREMRNSKIYVSPSGWCEYTPKDYEAMYFGALLIKPACEHIATEPNILIPNETYVPIKWDLSDLAEKCTFYLQNHDERNRITTNARNAYLGYFESKQFVNKFKEILDKIQTLKGVTLYSSCNK